MAAKLMLYVLAALSILIVLSSSLLVLPPRCGGFQVCRKQLMRVGAFIPWGIEVSIIRSVILAHLGRDGEKSR